MRLAESHFGFAEPALQKVLDSRATSESVIISHRISNLRYLPRIGPSAGEPPPDLPCIGANGCQNRVLKDF
jgi:hypothetical protein